MAQNNSVFVFVWKTSNNSRGGPNLIIDMNQVTNLKSLGFYMEKIGNWLGVSTSLWSQYFCNRPFCGRRCRKLVFVSVIAEADDSPGPTRWSFLLSPPVSLYWGTVILLLVEQVVAGFHQSALCNFRRIYKRLHCFFSVKKILIRLQIC